MIFKPNSPMSVCGQKAAGDAGHRGENPLAHSSPPPTEDERVRSASFAGHPAKALGVVRLSRPFRSGVTAYFLWCPFSHPARSGLGSTQRRLGTGRVHTCMTSRVVATIPRAAERSFYSEQPCSLWR